MALREVELMVKLQCIEIKVRLIKTVEQYNTISTCGHEVPPTDDFAGLCASGVVLELYGGLDHHGQDS